MDQGCISEFQSRRIWRRTGDVILRICATKGPGCRLAERLVKGASAFDTTTLARRQSTQVTGANGYAV